MNVLEHFDQNAEGEVRSRFEAVLKQLVVDLDPNELKFRATGRRVMVADLPKLDDRAARTVNLNITKLLEIEQEEMEVNGEVRAGLGASTLRCVLIRDTESIWRVLPAFLNGCFRG